MSKDRIGSIKDYTPNYKLIIPRFGLATWHDYIEENFRNIDALFFNLFGINNYSGSWKQITAYKQGQVLFIGDDLDINGNVTEFSGRLVKVLVDHVTDNSDYFNIFYNLHPEYYELFADAPTAQIYAQKAQQSATEALQSEINAKESETNSKNSEEIVIQKAAETSEYAKNTQQLVNNLESNVNSYIENFNSNAENKINAYNTNDVEKTNTFNQNYDEKFQNFNTNATQKTKIVNNLAQQAQTSATNASTSATNAAKSKDNAKIWAEGTDEQVQALGGVHSSKVWAEASTNINYTNITNCITEIPQDIKLELNNGTLTLKAGSKVYVPNGFEADGTTKKFDVITITKDLTYTEPTSAASTLPLFVSSNGNGLLRRGNNNSGKTVPDKYNGAFYNLATNRMESYNNGSLAATMGLPICVCTSTASTGNNMTSIDQVFNGFGYIGSTVFALPGVKGLIPNGRNSNGSLRNIEFVTDKVSIRTFTDSFTNNYNLYFNKNNIFSVSSADIYDGKSNTSSYGANIGKIVLANDVITSLTPKTAFHAVDWNDLEDKPNHLNNPFSLLDYKWSEYALSNASWLLSNGAFHSGATYVSVYELLLKIKNGTETKDGVSVKLSTESYTDTDFVINTADTTFRLPIKVKLASGNAVVGNGMTLGVVRGATSTAGTDIYGKEVYASNQTQNEGMAYWSSRPSNPVGVTKDPTKSGIETSSSGLKLYFYVGETIQDANVIAASQVLTKVANGIDRTVTTDRETVVGWGMPDYSAGVSKGWTNFIADSNGWIYVSTGANENQNIVTVNGAEVYRCGNNGYTDYNGAIAPVKKGDSIVVSGATHGHAFINFYPCRS